MPVKWCELAEKAGEQEHIRESAVKGVTDSQHSCLGSVGLGLPQEQTLHLQDVNLMFSA